LRDGVRGIIFDTMALGYLLLALELAQLRRKNRIALFRAARFTAPNLIGGLS